MIRVTLPDGRTINVDTDDKQEAAKAAKKFYDRSTGGVAENIAKGVGRGLTPATGADQLAQSISSRIGGADPFSAKLDTSGGEDTFAGKTGEFVGAGLAFGAPGLARTAGSQGLRSLLAALRGNVTGSVAAAAGSEVGGNVADAYGANRTVGELAGALAPGAIGAGLRSILSAGGTAGAAKRLGEVERLSGGAQADVGTVSGRSWLKEVMGIGESAPFGRGRVARKGREIRDGIYDFLAKTTRGDRAIAAGQATHSMAERGVTRWKAANRVNYARAESLIEKGMARKNIVQWKATGLKAAAEELDDLKPVLDELKRAPRYKQTAKLLESLKNRKAVPLTLQQLKQLRTEIGNAAGDAVLADQVKGAMKALYRGVTEDYRNLARVAGGQKAVTALDVANDSYRLGRKKVEKIFNPIIRKGEALSAEVAQSLFSKAQRPAGIARIRELFNAATPMEKEHFAKQMIWHIGKLQGKSANLERFATLIDDMPKDIKNVIFSTKALKEYRRDLEAVANLYRKEGGILQGGAQNIVNPGTTAGRGLETAGVVGFAMGGVGAALGAPAAVFLPAAIAAFALTGPTISRLMTSRMFVRWLAQADRVPLTKIGEYISRLDTIAKRDPAIASDIEELVSKINNIVEYAGQ